MAANKSHHFVPRCYLRNFSERPDGKTISLFNIARREIVTGAPIKSQCAKNFLYGHDELELHLSDIEGKYAEWITRGVLNDPPSIINDVDLFCRFFSLIQYMRTEANAARMRAHFALTQQLTNIPDDSEFSFKNIDTSDTALARDGIRYALEFQPHITDLKISFLRNSTDSDFVTCDDPIIMTNRFYHQRVGDSNFGFGSAGAIIYAPLSPKVGMIFYDNDVYSLNKINKFWTDIKNTSDIDKFNALVFLKAKENIYFSHSSKFSISSFLETEANRIGDWQRGKILVPVREDANGKVFREADDAPPEGNYVIWTSQQHPKPIKWPSVLRFRSIAYAYENGSGMGFVRKHTVPPGVRNVRKVRL